MGRGRPWRVAMIASCALIGATLIGCSFGSTSASPPSQPALVDGLPGNSSSPASESRAPVRPTHASPKFTKTHAAAPPTTVAPTEQPCAGFRGSNLSKTSVKNLLTSASARQPWVGVQQPSGLTKPLPKITVPLKLLKAIAAQESGWQSACKSNDGLGFGLFQVSQQTEDFVNSRFGKSYDRFVAADNVAIATTNLAWLLVYFGQFKFHETYSWSNTDLVDAVVAAFNVGYGTVDQGNTIVIPDYAQAYVNAVRLQELPTADCQHWG
jgi:Transglycosylase SLT domain